MNEPASGAPARATETPAAPRRIAVPAVVIGIVLLAAGATLTAMGRTLWCRCGSAVPWSWDVWSAHNSQHLLDPYSFTHVLHGLAFFAALWLIAGERVPLVWRAALTAVLESGWEILENSPIVIERYRTTTMSLDYFGDSVVNALADVAACLFGFWVASKLPWKVSVAIFVVTEVVLLLWVRDSLLVNILQLVYPLEAIKTWQMELLAVPTGG